MGERQMNTEIIIFLAMEVQREPSMSTSGVKNIGIFWTCSKRRPFPSTRYCYGTITSAWIATELEGRQKEVMIWHLVLLSRKNIPSWFSYHSAKWENSPAHPCIKSKCQISRGRARRRPLSTQLCCNRLNGREAEQGGSKQWSDRLRSALRCCHLGQVIDTPVEVSIPPWAGNN